MDDWNLASNGFRVSIRGPVISLLQRCFYTVRITIAILLNVEALADSKEHILLLPQLLLLVRVHEFLDTAVVEHVEQEGFALACNPSTLLRSVPRQVRESTEEFLLIVENDQEVLLVFQPVLKIIASETVTFCLALMNQ